LPATDVGGPRCASRGQDAPGTWGRGKIPPPIVPVRIAETLKADEAAEGKGYSALSAHSASQRFGTLKTDN